MNIVVCLKQVPDTNEVKIDPKTGTLIREGVPSIINPDDKNALEESLVMRDKGEFIPHRQILIYPALYNDYSERSPEREQQSDSLPHCRQSV